MRPTLTVLTLLALAACKGKDPGTETDAVDTDPVDTDTPTSTSGCDEVNEDHTVGLLLCDPQAAPGYTLFSPNASTSVYLVDVSGQLVHSWETDYRPGHSLYLLDSGNLMRTAQDNGGTQFGAGGAGGRVQEIEWDGTVVWDFEYKSNTQLQHHDIEPLPDGNVLMIAWQSYSQADALSAGRDPSLVTSDGIWVDHVIEVDPSSDQIVWEWHLWDHLVQEVDPGADNYGVVADHPELVDLNYVSGLNADWNHVNGIDYNAELDQIVLSSHNQDELWIIDHSTTRAEAATHSGGDSGAGGDLIYRWGNPQVYGAGTAQDKQLSGQHDTEWIPAGYPGEGNITIFNNGVQWNASEALEVEPPLQGDGSYLLTAGQAWGPAAPTWSFSDDGNFYSANISGTQRLPNGNTLICEGSSGHFFEVTTDGDIVWEYINPVGSDGPVAQGETFGGGGGGPGGPNNSVFRADRYAASHPGLSGKDLAPQGTVEL